MPRLSRRTRVISIRLSDEEFGQMQNLCAARGVENLSEMARAAMQRLVMQDSERKKGIDACVSEIQTRIGILDREIERISSLMGLARLEG